MRFALILLSFVFVLGHGRELVKQTDDLELKCKDILQSLLPECQEFCGKNPGKCLKPSKPLNLTIRNKSEKDIVIDVHVTTFNVDQMKINKENLQQWVYSGGNEPDLIVIGLQEVVNLKNPINFGGVELIHHKSWADNLEKYLPHKNGRPLYKKREHVGLVGIFLAVYQKIGLENRVDITEVKTSTAKTGTTFKKILPSMKSGNKGGVGISMKLNNFDICFVSSHLAAHQGDKYKDQRNKDFRTIREGLKFKSGGRTKTLMDHHTVIWMGDMNSRLITKLDVTDKAVMAKEITRVKNLIDSNHHMPLMEEDEIYASRKHYRERKDNSGIFYDFLEPKINFKPTFKFAMNGEYSDERVPAWCDRIMYWHKPGIGIQHAHDSYVSQPHVMLSDHKPVHSEFHIGLRTDLR